jgi:SAM-dependent methyltransferase
MTERLGRRAVQGLFARLRRHSRLRRYRRIQALLAVESLAGPVLDLGGGPASFFAALFPRPGQIVLVDLDGGEVSRAKEREPAISAIVADGGRLPLAGGSVAAVVCNSVIEHVDDPAALAREIRRVSRSYFLQTPNGKFPLETHSFVAIPFYRLIPSRRLKRLACRLFGGDLAYISQVRYLSEPALRRLFPEASVVYERLLGLHKSFYVYHSPAAGSEPS